MPEPEHELGKQGVELAKNYLCWTLKFDSFWQVYENPSLVGNYGLDGKFYTFDLTCGFFEKRDPLVKRPVYITGRSLNAISLENQKEKKSFLYVMW